MIRAPSRSPGQWGLWDELTVDSFAGGGGASIGIEAAIGRPVDVAINHSPDAIQMHAANHPFTTHHRDDIWNVNPLDATKGRPVGLAWFSPDCTHFSRAKGGKPCSKKIRGLAWVIVRWCRDVRPRVVMLENVPEFATWGPLGDDDRPDETRAGHYFDLWCRQLRKLGYALETKVLNAADYGAPTSRSRLFLIARRDGQPIVWPEPTHGPGTGRPYRSAAEIIDWTIAAPSIFLSPAEARAIGCRRPLAEKTLARVAAGVGRYVLCPEPYVVEGAAGTVSPWIVPRYGERPGQQPRTHDVRDPLPTIVPTGNGAQLVAAWMAQHNGGMVGHPMADPVSTISSRASQQQLVVQRLAADHGPDVAALLRAHGLKPGPVLVGGRQLRIADIGMRMLTVRELYRAQGFPDDYVTDHGADGRALTKSKQLRLVGNSVSPYVSEALVRANLGAEVAERARTAA